MIRRLAKRPADADVQRSPYREQRSGVSDSRPRRTAEGFQLRRAARRPRTGTGTTATTGHVDDDRRRRVPFPHDGSGGVGDLGVQPDVVAIDVEMLREHFDDQFVVGALGKA